LGSLSRCATQTIGPIKKLTAFKNDECAKSGNTVLVPPPAIVDTTIVGATIVPLRRACPRGSNWAGTFV